MGQSCHCSHLCHMVVVLREKRLSHSYDEFTLHKYLYCKWLFRTGYVVTIFLRIKQMACLVKFNKPRYHSKSCHVLRYYNPVLTDINSLSYFNFDMDTVQFKVRMYCMILKLCFSSKNQASSRVKVRVYGSKAAWHLHPSLDQHCTPCWLSIKQFLWRILYYYCATLYLWIVNRNILSKILLT